MFKNKFSLLPLVCMASFLWVTSVEAGGDYLMPPAQQVATAKSTAPAAQYKLYVQADLGYSHVAWNNFSLATGTMTQASDGGFAYGLVAGMTLNSVLGVQAGWLNLPSTRYQWSGGSHTVDSYLLYGAATLSVPYGGFSSLYGLVGLTYRNLSNTASFGGGSHSSLLFGLGAKYPVFSFMNVGVEYLHQPGVFTGQSQDRAPNANLFLITASYHFTL